MTTTTTTTRSVVIEREMAHSREKVWRALTEGALIEQWLMKNDFAPVVGHPFKYRMELSAEQKQGWDGVIDCEVLVVEPGEKLAYSWSTMGLPTVVTFTLTPTAAGVLLRMEQSGFGAENDRAFQGAKYGWQNFLGKLEGVAASL
jgi:uncharacterized protein YndB with AHSA1/START domain